MTSRGRRWPRRRHDRDRRQQRQRSAGEKKDHQVCVVIADDSVLLREGIARLLVESGFEVVGQAGDAEDLCARSARTSPNRGGRRAHAADPHR